MTIYDVEFVKSDITAAERARRLKLAYDIILDYASRGLDLGMSQGSGAAAPIRDKRMRSITGGR